MKLPPKKKPSGRKPGGQPGHEGHHREPLPPNKVTRFEHHWPQRCEGCHRELPRDRRVEVGEPLCHQVTELPEVVAETIEHQLHTMKPLQRRVEDLLRRGVVSGVPRVAGMCWDIGGIHAEALWTFVEVEGVEPTNHQSERGLRHAVIWRKSSYGSHSEAGSRLVERMLAVRATLRAQGRNVVQFVTQAVHASLNNLPLPSLLPDAVAATPPRRLALAA